MKYCIALWILLVFALCGCSEDTDLPSKVLQQLSKADRLEVTNRFWAFGTNITGADVRSLTTAIKSARKKRLGTGLDWQTPNSWDLTFFAGTNKLIGFPICYRVFKIEGIEYIERSNVVTGFWKKLEGDQMR